MDKQEQMESVGRLLGDARRREATRLGRDVQRDEMAKRYRVAYSTYTPWERGERIPGPEYHYNIYRQLDKEQRRLFCEILNIRPPLPKSKLMEWLNDNLERFNERDQERLYEYAIELLDNEKQEQPTETIAQVAT